MSNYNQTNIHLQLTKDFAVTEDKKSNLVFCVTKRHLFRKLDTNFNDRNIGVRIDGKIIPSLTNMLRNKSCLLSHDFSGSHIYYVLLSPSNFERILWVWKDMRSMISRSGNHILGIRVSEFISILEKSRIVGTLAKC